MWAAKHCSMLFSSGQNRLFIFCCVIAVNVCLFAVLKRAKKKGFLQIRNLTDLKGEILILARNTVKTVDKYDKAVTSDMARNKLQIIYTQTAAARESENVKQAYIN